MKVNTEKINGELERRKWSITKLALESGITRQALYLIFDKETASLKTINKIGKALNYDPKDLLI